MRFGTWNVRNLYTVGSHTAVARESGNACYHSVLNPLSSIVLSSNLKIKKCITTILPIVLYGCETWSLTLREERRLTVFEGNIWV